MEASLESRAEELVKEFDGQATTVEERNGFVRSMMKSALERMLNGELDVHLARKGLAGAEPPRGESPPATPPWA